MEAAGNPGEMGMSESQEPFIKTKEAAAPAALLRPGQHAPRFRSIIRRTNTSCAVASPVAVRLPRPHLYILR